MKRAVKFIPAAAVLVLTLSCAFKIDKLSSGSADFVPSKTRLIADNRVPGYAMVRDQVFAKHCLMCHASGMHLPALDRFTDSHESAMSIFKQVFTKKTMPKGQGGTLDSDENALLARWLQNGAPENEGPMPQPTPSISPSSSPSPSPSSEPAHQWSWSEINKKVFAPRCAQCHNDTHASKNVNVTHYLDVVANKDDIVSEALEDLTMPPKKGGGPLTQEEQSSLREWIAEGMPQGEPDPTVSASPSPSPEPSPSPAASPSPVIVPVSSVTWAAINKQVFAPHCAKCHNDSRSAKGVNLTNYPDVVNNKGEIDIQVFQTQEMPPTGSLSDSELKALRTWIDEGMPKE
ncbi:MAG: c-type cytochrome [Bdellovibrionota bacterium]